MELSDDEKLIVRDLHLLTLKPVLYAANLSEDGVAEADSNPYVQQVRDFAVAENAIVVPISAKVEAEIAELEGEDKAMFLEELGLEESGLNRLIKVATVFWDCTPTLRQACRKYVPGRSAKERRLRKRQA